MTEIKEDIYTILDCTENPGCEIGDMVKNGYKVINMSATATTYRTTYHVLMVKEFKYDDGNEVVNHNIRRGFDA